MGITLEQLQLCVDKINELEDQIKNTLGVVLCDECGVYCEAINTIFESCGIKCSSCHHGFKTRSHNEKH